MSRPRLVIFLAFALASHCVAQQPATPATPATNQDPFQNLRFRNLGPAVAGGRISSVVGVPGNPKLYYAGAAAGGVFKSEDGGQSWKPIFEHEATASIGAIALAPSNPNLLWVGTGEPNLRNDITTGHGVYFSPDGGATWQFKGLADAGQIASVIVNAHDPNIVLVGVVGHAWGPNPERGVFRSTDAGKTWQKVLYIDDKTGVSDMAVDPGNPMIVYAGMWAIQRTPWEMVSGGATSGIYRSLDGGATWKKLSEGFPKGPTGRIGLAVARSNSRHIYALVESKDGVLWDSHDYGDHWTKVTDNMLINARPWYFGRFAVAPNNEEKLYFLSFDLMLSNDGGKTARNIGRGVHADHHAIWIDPADPQRILEGNDGGVYLSWNGGDNWRFLDDLPIAQLYSVSLDDKTPFNLCAGLQDNSAWCGPSQTLNRGSIPNNEWWTTIGGDGQYAVPGLNSPLVYSDSQNGYTEVLDQSTGQTRHIRPYLLGQEEVAPADLKYRFNWTSPIAVAAHDPHEVYLGANVLFRSTDAGKSWQPISPDLTRNDKSKQVMTGGPILYDISGAEVYDTILSIALSPQDPKTVWIGTDDGVVQTTRDGGAHWENVTPKSASEWGRVQQIEVSPFDPQSAYVAIDFHETDDNRPYVFRTHDGGATWTSISRGLPETASARVVREDPNQKGLLIAGTDTGLFVSKDDGDNWTPLKGDFPTVPVYDLKFHQSTRDLIVATHGRGLYALDDLSPLEQWDAQVASAPVHLFSIEPAHFWNSFNKYGRSAGGGWSAANRAKGAIINYWLAHPPVAGVKLPAGQTPIRIAIADPSGKIIRTFYGPAKAGMNRAIWDLSEDAPRRLRFASIPSDEESPRGASGPLALPGTYKLTLTFNGQSQTTPIEISPDPRFPFDLDAFKKQQQLALELRDQISLINEALNRSASLHNQIAALERQLQQEETAEKYRPLLEKAQALDKQVVGWQEPVFNPAIENDSKYYLHYLARLHDRLQRTFGNISSDYDTAPNNELVQEVATLRPLVSERVKAFDTLVNSQVAAFNQQAQQLGAPTLYAGSLQGQ